MRHTTYIQAGAGSGKTYTLTKILSHLIVEGKAQPEQFILTTFTIAAAEEFKEKAKEQIYECTHCPNYAEYAERLDQAMIGTVDSVAYAFVRKYWYLLSISPELKMLEEEQTSFYINQLLSKIATQEQIDFFIDFCQQFNITYSFNSNNYGYNFDFWKADVEMILDKRKSYQIQNMDDCKQASLDLADEICGNWNLNVDAEMITNFITQYEAINKSNETAKTLRKLKRSFSTKIKLVDIAELEKLLDAQQNKPRNLANLQKIPDYQAVYDSIHHVYTSRQAKELITKYIETVFAIARTSEEAFDAYKDQHHLIDFTDMEVRFLKLLDNPVVRADIKENYRYVFVDEFQDSSPIQVMIFDKLSEIVGNPADDDYIVTIGEGKNAKDFHIHNSIWVGDFKQAIYGFRGADTDLTKAVADSIATNHSSAPEEFIVQTLDKSYRSLQGIVDFTNHVFDKAFQNVLTPDQIELSSFRGNPQNLQSLKYLALGGGRTDSTMETLASIIAKQIVNGNRTSDIAVLARENATLDILSDKLKKLNIPVNREIRVGVDRNEFVLLCSLLNIVQNRYDDYSRACIAFIVQNNFGAGELIDSRLEYLADQDEKVFLDSIDILRRLMEKYDFYRTQTVHNLVQSLVIDLDLFSAGKSWGRLDSTEVFMALIEAAAEYEERCGQMGLPPTINGYMDYCQNFATSQGSKDGVTLLTFHGSKGLEWKKVYMLDVDEDLQKEDKIIKRYIFGVQKYHDVLPSSQTLYPSMKLTLFPQLFSGNTAINGEIEDNAKNSSRYAPVLQEIISEEKRLYYVAITRAKDELVLVSESIADHFKAFETLGCTVSTHTSYCNDSSVDLLGTGDLFSCECLMLGENDSLNIQWPVRINLKKNSQTEYPHKFIQPSKASASVTLVPNEVFNTKKRITIKAKAEQMDKIGTCIHDIFCFLEKDEDPARIASFIKASGYEKELPEPAEILEAWTQFESFMRTTYGEGSLHHELPFTHSYGGFIYNGSIDLVWETAQGVVLVDYKTFPGTKAQILDKTSDFYAGKYSGQFECYEKALKAAGKKVITKLIYYAVGGVVVELR